MESSPKSRRRQCRPMAYYGAPRDRREGPHRPRNPASNQDCPQRTTSPQTVALEPGTHTIRVEIRTADMRQMMVVKAGEEFRLGFIRESKDIQLERATPGSLSGYLSRFLIFFVLFWAPCPTVDTTRLADRPIIFSKT